MQRFTMHTPETAPEASRAKLAETQKSLGFLPNLDAGLAESPVALEAYNEISRLFGRSRLSPVEQQVVALAVSVENECEYCVGAHTVIAKNTVKLPSAIIDALRNGGKLPDAKLDALATFARTLVRRNGRVDDAAVKGFMDAGFDRGQLLDVIVGISLKTLTNYSNHIMGTTLDKAFESGRWSRTRKAA